MVYRVPLADYRHIFHALVDLPGLLALRGEADEAGELVSAVLAEQARYVESEIAPLNRQGDASPPVWSEAGVAMPDAFRQAYASFRDGGWQGLSHPEAVGGQGLPRLVAAAAGESLNAACLAFALCPLLTDGVIEALSTAASPALQARYLPPLLAGRWTGTMNLTEPQAGSDLAQVRTVARRQEDGSYRLSGQKIFITYGEHDLAENIVHLVLARTPGAPEGVKGLSLFVVPRRLVQEDGSLGARNDVWCAGLERKLGIHGSPTAVLMYGANKGEVGEGAIGHLVGEEGRGLAYMFVMMNAARYAVGVQGVALAERALQHAEAYAAERIQGVAVGDMPPAGPILRHPDVQRLLITMRARTEGARALAFVAAAAADRARLLPDEDARRAQQALYEFLVPVVKAHATESAVEVASMGLQVHGGTGYIEDTGAAQLLRDARILPIYEGTTAIQANDFVSRKVWRDGGEVARRCLAGLCDTATGLLAASGPESPALHAMGRALAAAAEAATAATDYVLSEAQARPRAVFLGSVPYLDLMGTALAGWQLARAMQWAASAQTDADTVFARRKLATGLACAQLLLPRTKALAAAVTQAHDLAPLLDAVFVDGVANG